MKRLTPQQITGEAGIALIARRTAEMGHVWHQRQVDAGIDGEIELRDATTGAVSNRILLVQSKASERSFPAENDESFHYVVDPRDLEYWLGGNAPVILICSHPTAQQAWWVHINEWFSDAARRESRKVHFDKAAQVFDASAAAAITRLSAAAGTGVYLGVPPRTEVLRSNLLPVERVPELIYSAAISETRAAVVGPALREAGLRRGDWMIRGGRVYSFQAPTEPIWNTWLTSSVLTQPTASWMCSSAEDVRWTLADLLNRALKDSLHEQLAWQGKKRLLYFKATARLTPRRIQGRKRQRTVFKAYPKKQTPAETAYCRHDALSLSYLPVDGQWLAQLSPTYLFTSDGHRESPYAADHLAGIKRLERNGAVAASVGMWASYLRGDHAMLGDSDRVIGFGELLSFESSHGIDDRNWTGKKDIETREAALTLREPEPVDLEVVDSDDPEDDDGWALF